MTFELVRNPAFEGRKPTPLQAACHDRTPFLTVRCSCGYELHLHESQLEQVPADYGIATSCHRCGELLDFEPGFFARAFQQLRDEGWYE